MSFNNSNTIPNQCIMSSKMLNFEFLYLVLTISTCFSSSKLIDCYVPIDPFMSFSIVDCFFVSCLLNFVFLLQSTVSPMTHSCSLAFSFPCLHFLCPRYINSLDAHKSLYLALMCVLSFRILGLKVHSFCCYRFFSSTYWHNLASR